MNSLLSIFQVKFQFELVEHLIDCTELIQNPLLKEITLLYFNSINQTALLDVFICLVHPYLLDFTA